MLHEKLELASKNASTKRLRIVLSIVGIALFVGLALFSVSLYQEVTELRGELANKAPPAPENLKSTGVDRIKPSGATSRMSDAEIDKRRPKLPLAQPSRRPLIDQAVPPQADMRQKNLPPPIQIEPPPTPLDNASKPSPAIPPNLSGTPSVEDGNLSRTVPPQPAEDQSTEKRDLFKTALKDFEREIEPGISTQGFVNWSVGSQRDLVFLKNAAIAAFSVGEYDKALTHIQKASSLASESLNAKKSAYNQAMGNAKNARNSDDYVTGKESIKHALHLEPNSKAARQLSDDIDALPKIIDHLRAAEIARTENNLQHELENLLKILKLDPSRKAVKERAATVSAEIKERTFARHISNGLANVENRQLKSARARLTKARRLFPKRDETIILSGKVAKLESDLKTEQLIRAAQNASSNDDWIKSVALYSEARKTQPNNQLTVDGFALAQSITSLQSEVSEYLNSPHRLSSRNVAAGASRLIERSSALAGNSTSLDQKTSSLTEVLASYREEVSVRVISDGVSRVSVRGIGRVGIAKEKVIKLRPGTYTFEGSRTGYKSKLVKVSISPRAAQFKVEVICDERI